MDGPVTNGSDAGTPPGAPQTCQGASGFSTSTPDPCGCEAQREVRFDSGLEIYLCAACAAGAELREDTRQVRELSPGERSMIAIMRAAHLRMLDDDDRARLD